MINNLAITLIAGAIAIVTMICITALLISGVDVPSEFYGILGTAAGAAVLGGAVTQGASIAKKDDDGG